MSSISQMLGKAADSDCSDSCAGNSSTKCGRSGDRGTVYAYNPAVRIKCSPTDFSKYVPCLVLSFATPNMPQSLTVDFGNGINSSLSLYGKKVLYFLFNYLLKVL